MSRVYAACCSSRSSSQELAVDVDGVAVELLADVVRRRGAGVLFERGDTCAVLARLALDRPRQLAVAAGERRSW